MRNFPRVLAFGLAFAVLAGGCATNIGLTGLSEGPRDGYTVLVDGIGHRQIVSPAPFSRVSQIVEVDLSKGRFALRLTRGDTSGGKEYRSQTTSTYTRQTGALIGVNAGFFGPVVDAEGVAMDAAGFVVADGVVTSPPLIPQADSAVVKAVVCFAPRQVIIDDTKSCPSTFREGLAAGPRLLRDGMVAADPANTTRHPRTALGISARGDRVWFVVTDGRQAGYSEGATLTEMADLLKGLGAINAINLDGGGSSAIVFADPQTGQRVLNRPIQNGSPGRERPVATHIGVFSVSSARN
jgi:exopolysaccharide biosynthesis protein